MALSTTYSDYKKVSDVRLNKIDARRTLANTIERASTIVYNISVANTDAGDHNLGIAAYDMELVKAYVNIRGDEGTNGLVSIEKWDTIAKGGDDLMTGTGSVDGGAAELFDLTVVTDGGQYITAGEVINMVTTGLDGSVEGIVTLVFKLVDNVDNS
tara:strand:+ start:796 stop:1263 length:468 start_codon:yes stop_codon:yes gene_type:complete